MCPWAKLTMEMKYYWKRLKESLPEQTGLIVYLVICLFIYFLEKFPFHKPTCKPIGRFYNLNNFQVFSFVDKQVEVKKVNSNMLLAFAVCAGAQYYCACYAGFCSQYSQYAIKKNQTTIIVFLHLLFV